MASKSVPFENLRLQEMILQFAALAEGPVNPLPDLPTNPPPVVKRGWLIRVLDPNPFRIRIESQPLTIPNSGLDLSDPNDASAARDIVRKAAKKIEKEIDGPPKRLINRKTRLDIDISPDVLAGEVHPCLLAFHCDPWKRRKKAFRFFSGAVDPSNIMEGDDAKEAINGGSATPIPPVLSGPQFVKDGSAKTIMMYCDNTNGTNFEYALGLHYKESRGSDVETPIIIDPKIKND